MLQKLEKIRCKRFGAISCTYVYIQHHGSLDDNLQLCDFSSASTNKDFSEFYVFMITVCCACIANWKKLHKEAVHTPVLNL